MVKRISWIGITILFGVAAVTLLHSDCARAGGIYNLEYPQGYGKCCPPNVQGYGYFRTGWREWPGEIRLDKSFPRSIGMEAIPAPAGQEIVPTPKATETPKVPIEIPPSLEPQGGVEKPAEETPPGEMPAEPEKETPVLPGLPPEQGGYNPLPGLPPDLGTPAPINPEEKKEDNSTAEPKQDAESKPESEPKTDATEKDKSEAPSPDAKPKEGETRIELPSNTQKVGHLDPVSRSSNIARGAIYHEPAESPMVNRFSRDIVPQSYQKSSESNEASAVAQSDLEIDASSNELRQNAESAVLEGFCPVELSLHGRWAPGDRRWTAAYKGLIYRFSGNAERQEFLANPEKYIPANGGFDPVLSVAERRNVPGQVNFCAAYKGRIYMFSSAVTQDNFHKNPEAYVGGAMK